MPIPNGVDGGMPMNGMSMNGMQMNGMPMGGSAIINVPEKKQTEWGPIIKTIALIVLTLACITLVGLFIWKNNQYEEAQSDVDEKIAEAVAEAKDEQAEKDEKEFAEREKYPYRNFAGPADYGQLSFEYPKTWSLYIEKDASNGGDYMAYFNPIEVEVVSNNTINALRVEILDRAFDDVARNYQNAVEGDRLDLEVITVGGTTANKYTGLLPDTEDFSGIVVLFKIRDKTVVLRTDSVLFTSDFERLLSTVAFNA